jgi:hypothetical protein
MAFERLDHAYLVRDEAAVGRELALIETLRDEAAEAVEAARRTSGAADPSLLDRVRTRLGSAVDQLLQLPVAPALVRSATPATTVVGDATIGDDERGALGHGVEVSAVVNGVELGIDIVGVDAHIEDRVRLLVDRDGDLVAVTLISAMPGIGVLSAMVPWTASLPARLIVVIVAETGPPEPRPR